MKSLICPRCDSYFSSDCPKCNKDAYLGDLKEGAAQAVEIFGEDELERYAANLRRFAATGE